MKTRFALAAAIAAFVPSIAFAQAGTTPPKKEADHHQGGHHASSGWKELDAFHNLLATTWHPLESGADFKPVREHATHLADAAKAWSAAKAPAGCDSKEIKDAIAATARKSSEVADLVTKNAPEADIKTAMKALHDGFEKVEHGCKPKK